jgi:hypothetical protein
VEKNEWRRSVLFGLSVEEMVLKELDEIRQELSISLIPPMRELASQTDTVEKAKDTAASFTAMLRQSLLEEVTAKIATASPKVQQRFQEAMADPSLAGLPVPFIPGFGSLYAVWLYALGHTPSDNKGMTCAVALEMKLITTIDEQIGPYFPWPKEPEDAPSPQPATPVGPVIPASSEAAPSQQAPKARIKVRVKGKQPLSKTAPQPKPEPAPPKQEEAPPMATVAAPEPEVVAAPVCESLQDRTLLPIKEIASSWCQRVKNSIGLYIEGLLVVMGCNLCSYIVFGAVSYIPYYWFGETLISYHLSNYLNALVVFSLDYFLSPKDSSGRRYACIVGGIIAVAGRSLLYFSNSFFMNYYNGGHDPFYFLQLTLEHLPVIVLGFVEFRIGRKTRPATNTK